MELTAEEAAAVERAACPACAAPAGRPCRSRAGDTAFRYHTPRFVLVPGLAGAPEVLVPDDRGPGQPWRAAPAAPAVRVGYASSPAGTAAGELDSQAAALRAAGCTAVFREETGARRARPQLEQAVRAARELAASRGGGAGAGHPAGRAGPAGVLTVQELRRLARDAAELIAVCGVLRDREVCLEVLGGPLAGLHEPGAAGVTLFGVLGAAGELNRAHRRAATLAGQRAAAARGRPGGRPRVLDEQMTATALELRDQGVPVPGIAARLVITSGPRAGRHPSLASVYRALAGAAAAGQPDPPGQETAGTGPPDGSRA